MRQRTLVPLVALLALDSACGGRAGSVATSILPVAPADSGPTVTVDSLGAVVARQAGRVLGRREPRIIRLIHRIGYEQDLPSVVQRRCDRVYRLTRAGTLELETA